MRDLAGEFLAAFETGRVGLTPPSSTEPGFDMSAAYGVEAEFARLRAAAGHQPAGRKVGYANKAMWRVLKLETLVWAHMYDDTVHFAEPGHAAQFSRAAGGAPKIEPEIVFKLRAPLAGIRDATAILDAIEWMAIGFEIIDCPYPGWQFKPADFVAAWGFHKALIAGQPAPAGTADQLANFKVRLLKNGHFAEEGSGKNSLRSPALCLAELASITGLGAGEIISTGTLTAAQPVCAGEVWSVETEGLSVPGLTLHLT